MNNEIQINTSQSEWIEVEDNQNAFTIDNFSFEDGIDENLTKPHCVPCVAVNKWQKNLIAKEIIK